MKTPKAPEPAAPSAAGSAAPAESSAALVAALASLLAPVAELSVARGLPAATVEELLKAAFVEAARRAQPESAGARIVSRVATATGLTRREVTRLLGATGALPAVRPSPATQVFTRWQTDRSLRKRGGAPMALPRTGPAPSFEALARTVTQDVHPRSLLEELVRLGLVAVEGETVRLLGDRVVAGGDSERAYRFVANNVGDHLRASVANLLAETPPHVEQAVFADELSEASMAAFRDLARARWQALLAAAVPELQALVDADAAHGRPRDRRVRLGFYSYHEQMAEEAVAPLPAARRPARKDR